MDADRGLGRKSRRTVSRRFLRTGVCVVVGGAKRLDVARLPDIRGPPTTGLTDCGTAKRVPIRVEALDRYSGGARLPVRTCRFTTCVAASADGVRTRKWAWRHRRATREIPRRSSHGSRGRPQGSGGDGRSAVAGPFGAGGVIPLWGVGGLPTFILRLSSWRRDAGGPLADAGAHTALPRPHPLRCSLTLNDICCEFATLCFFSWRKTPILNFSGTGVIDLEDSDTLNPCLGRKNATSYPSAPRGEACRG